MENLHWQKAPEEDGSAASRPSRLLGILQRGWSIALRRALSDHQLHAVLLVWALCWAAYFALLVRFCVPLPWSDEWDMTEVATRQLALDQEWIWRPLNEHRAPLVRLEVLLLGQLASWDLRLVHHVNLAMLALGSLTLILAVRKVRGCSAFCDAFLPLLIFTPWHYESLLVYALAYAMPLALLCVALSGMITGWPQRSVFNLVVYWGMTLAITLSGGPIGHLWALGLCGVAVRGRLENRPRRWQVAAAVGAGIVIGISLAMLLATPEVARHEKFLSDSWQTTLRATAKLSVVWLGRALELWWPWALLAVVIPGLYVAGRAVLELWRIGRGSAPAKTNLGSWLDLVLVLLATVAVALMIGHGRGLSPRIWQPRYATLIMPMPLVLYLLMVRWRSALIIPGMLTFLMAVSIGWNWPIVLADSRYWHDRGMEAAQALRQVSCPLAAAAEKYAPVVGYTCDSNKLLRLLMALRDAHMSVFRKQSAREPVAGMGPAQLWDAAAGQVTAGLRMVADIRATSGLALEPASSWAPGTVTYAIEVPEGGCYELSCRLAVPERDASLAVRVDDGLAFTRSLQPGGEYSALCHQPVSLELSPGKHLVALTLTGRRTRLNLLELIPRGRDGRETVAQASQK
jgi:hypothetical protein